MSDILMTERESLVIYEKINKKKKKKLCTFFHYEYFPLLFDLL